MKSFLFHKSEFLPAVIRSQSLIKPIIHQTDRKIQSGQWCMLGVYVAASLLLGGLLAGCITYIAVHLATFSCRNRGCLCHPRLHMGPEVMTRKCFKGKSRD